MLSDLVVAGQVVDLEAVRDEEEGKLKDAPRKVYRTKVFDVLSEDQLEIMMPIERGILIPLPVDGNFDMSFYTAKGLYHCYGRVLDRYKSNNVHIMVAEVTSNLKKRQRREFYRLDCAMRVEFRPLTAREATAAQQGYFRPNPMESELLEGEVADLSGGGMRFTAQSPCEPGSIIFCTYELTTKAGLKRYNLLGRVMRSEALEKRPGTYENRIQYVDMDVDDREEIIKFIFEEERRQRHKATNR